MKRVMASALAACLVVNLAHAQVGRSQGGLDPNFASEKELLAVPHLNAAIVKSLVSRRPFLNASEWNTFLAKQLDTEPAAAVRVQLFLPINLNTASRDEILLVPGVGKRMAHEFEEYRPYKSLEQFRKEIGKYVDTKEVARLEQYVFVPINLNDASDAEILTIPGLGKRMLHEFKEYRPYTSIEQFRKEIGKYVDAKEVARLESYVTLE